MYHYSNTHNTVVEWETFVYLKAAPRVEAPASSMPQPLRSKSVSDPDTCQMRYKISDQPNMTNRNIESLKTHHNSTLRKVKGF